MHPIAELDHRFVWHPFTQMRDWLKKEPIVITSGKGAILRDVNGKEYLDANSSIWTNLHGHNHPRINAAIRDQLERVAHTSFLGYANPRAAELAEALVGLWRPNTLTRVFFSDDGSTATPGSRQSGTSEPNAGRNGRSAAASGSPPARATPNRASVNGR
jgi:adenosylmethionine-8-amino-7-oxononanoate aminotransferase